MTLPGGAANKLGNRYEAYWTVRQLLQVLAGEAREIRIEPPGVDKMEFWLAVDDTREFHQAKRRHPQGAWTLARLRGDGLLEAVFQRLQGGADTFVFVSRSDAPELSDLSEAARGASSQQEFEREFLKADSRRRPFGQLLEIWGCDSAPARELLRRIKVRTIDEWTLREGLRSRVRVFFADDETQRVVDALFRIVADSVHKTVGRESLRACLARRGLSLRPSAAPQTATELIHAATDRYLQGARRKLILGRVRSRKQARDIVDHLKRSDEPSQCAITGKAGIGKTASVVDIIERLRESLRACLARRGLSLRPSAAPQTATELIHAATDRYLQGARRKLILGRVRSRKQARDIVDHLKRSDEPSQCAITGKAGIGKTASVVDIIERLRELEMPVLAFRMDRLSDVATMQALAAHLEFGTESGLDAARSGSRCELPRRAGNRSA